MRLPPFSRLRSPVALLMIMTVAMQLSFAVWWTLIKNFAVEDIAFTGREIGIQESIREIPGFLAFLAVFLLLVMRQQTMAILSLCLLGVGVAATGFFPTVVGLYLTTLVMSIGFHYYETASQALQLQWLPKDSAPIILGRIVAVAAGAQIFAYAFIYGMWDLFSLTYVSGFLIAGGMTLMVALTLWFAFPAYDIGPSQHKKIILRRRYLLYYALTFLGGARRQIFMVFAGFMMVEKFGYDVKAIALLFLINGLFSIFFAPMIGKMIVRWGERRALTFEYVGLIIVFVAYAFVENGTFAAFLYVVDHVFFALAIAIKTYFQKIADPRDIGPTAGVAFTINHIAAVFIPVVFGLIWLQSPAAVFLCGAAMAAASLMLARIVPSAPEPGNEFSWKSRYQPEPAE